MPYILSVATYQAPHRVHQADVLQLAKSLFEAQFPDIERLLTVFHNGQIRRRSFVKPLDWYQQPRSFEERNEAYIDCALRYGAETVLQCLQSETYLKRFVAEEEIEAIFYISSTGIATPTIEARLMNQLHFQPNTKRIPLWGLGCAGGAAGLARAFDYCLAYPKAKVLVLCVEFCSLTFMHQDHSKSNLVGSSLFSDGVACALLAGDEVELEEHTQLSALLRLRATRSVLLPHTEDVMGWKVRDNGLQVVFAKSIPQLVEQHFAPLVNAFLTATDDQLTAEDLTVLLAHPGGMKVLQAMSEALKMEPEKLDYSRRVLEAHGNMSSATVLYVIDQYLQERTGGANGDATERANGSPIERTAGRNQRRAGLITAMGPGFSTELIQFDQV